MSLESQYEQEENYLIEQFNGGLMTQSEYYRAMRELQLDYQAQAKDAAQNAYDEEMSRWY